MNSYAFLCDFYAISMHFLCGFYIVLRRGFALTHAFFPRKSRIVPRTKKFFRAEAGNQESRARSQPALTLRVRDDFMAPAAVYTSLMRERRTVFPLACDSGLYGPCQGILPHTRHRRVTAPPRLTALPWATSAAAGRRRTTARASCRTACPG